MEHETVLTVVLAVSVLQFFTNRMCKWAFPCWTFSFWRSRSRKCFRTV